MQNEKFTALLNGKDTRAFAQAASTDAIYALLNAAGDPGASVPRCFTVETASVTEIKKVSDPEKLAYVEGERFDPTGMELAERETTAPQAVVQKCLKKRFRNHAGIKNPAGGLAHRPDRSA